MRRRDSPPPGSCPPRWCRPHNTCRCRSGRGSLPARRSGSHRPTGRPACRWRRARLLPLRLARQPLARPGAVSGSLIPVHIDHRVASVGRVAVIGRTAVGRRWRSAPRSRRPPRIGRIARWSPQCGRYGTRPGRSCAATSRRDNNGSRRYAPDRSPSGTCRRGRTPCQQEPNRRPSRQVANRPSGPRQEERPARRHPVRRQGYQARKPKPAGEERGTRRGRSATARKHGTGLLFDLLAGLYACTT